MTSDDAISPAEEKANDDAISPAEEKAGADVVQRFGALWRSLQPIGRDEHTGGYLRYAFTDEERACREWFEEEALDRDLTVETDRNGNLWAWWGDRHAGGAVVTGSHFDSVPHGGAFDGPLGIVSALLAIDRLREQGFEPAHPIGVVAFAEEEGSRFGVACLGSRLLTGTYSAQKARALEDPNGHSLGRVLGEAAADLGAEPDRVSQLKAFVELHIEQGRALVDLDAPVGVASAIWPHGRWRFDFTGEANHAGTTRMADRHDPMLTFAYTVLAANKEARLADAHATMGRVHVAPNATNAIAAEVTAWLDARAPQQPTLEELVTAIRRRAEERAARDGTGVVVTAESVSPVIDFEHELRDRIVATLGGVPVLPTAAGHDAGVLSAAGVPTTMLFVRNPTGISHAPSEHASDVDCAAGVEALATVLRELAGS